MSTSNELRKRYLHIGRQYGSPQVIKQANKTLRGLDLYLAVLIAFGASRVDAGRLLGCRDELVRLGGDREGERLWSMSSTRERRARIQKAKDVRRRGQTLLSIAADGLLERDDEDSKRILSLVNAAQAKAGSSGADAFKLKTQLDDLSVVYSQPLVQKVLEENNVTQYVCDLDEARSGIALVIEELKPQNGTPESTEQINVLDGEIVTLCRRFRAIARLAGHELGRAALADAFELDELYGSVRRKSEEKPEAPETAETPQGESAAG